MRRREIVGGFQWEDFWIIGRWDPWAAARMAEKWRHPSLAARMSTRNDPEIRQTISNTAKLLSCFTPFGRFGPNILFCQQLWTHNSANPASIGNFVGCWGRVDSYITLSWISLRFAFSHTSLLAVVATVAFLCLQYPPSVDYPWLSAALWLVIKPPLWLVLMCRPFVEMWTLCGLIHSSFNFIHFGAVFVPFDTLLVYSYVLSYLLHLDIPWCTLE